MIFCALLLATMLAGEGGVAADSTGRPPAVGSHRAPAGSPLEFHAPPPMWQVRPNMPALHDTIGADVAGVEDSLALRIEPFCAHVWPNTVVRFRVRVANRSKRAILLVSPPRGGSAREAPLASSRVEAPKGWAARRQTDLVVGFFRQKMQLSDFISVPAGKQVDLFGPDGYVSPSWDGWYPGRYVVRFTYSTMETNPRVWLGTFQPDSLDADWRAHFRRVPRVELHAECSVDVQQR